MDPTIDLCRIPSRKVIQLPIVKHRQPVQDFVPEITTSNDIQEYVVDDDPKIGFSIFAHRAAVILANIDALFNFTGHTGGFLRYATFGQFTFCDLGSGPGGFTEYIQFRRPDSFGYGITSKNHQDWDDFHIESSRFRKIYGQDNSGDLRTQWYDFSRTVRETEVEGVDIVVSNGNDMIPEILITLYTLTVGGTFVMKILNFESKLTRQLLFLLSQVFESITIIKPMSASKYYFIGVGFKKSVDFIDLLMNANNENVVSILHSYPDSFNKYLDSIRNQETKDNLDYQKALILWNLP